MTLFEITKENGTVLLTAEAIVGFEVWEYPDGNLIQILTNCGNAIPVEFESSERLDDATAALAGLLQGNDAGKSGEGEHTSEPSRLPSGPTGDDYAERFAEVSAKVGELTEGEDLTVLFIKTFDVVDELNHTPDSSGWEKRARSAPDADVAEYVNEMHETLFAVDDGGDSVGLVHYSESAGEWKACWVDLELFGSLLQRRWVRVDNEEKATTNQGDEDGR